MTRLPEYYIPNYVHCTFDKDAVVFMNLRHDQYSLLLGSQARTFKSLLSNSVGEFKRTIVQRELGTADDATERDLIRELLDVGLLTEDGTEACYSPPPSLPLPQQSLLDPDSLSNSPRCGINEFLGFFSACLITAVRLSCFGIEHTVSVIKRRKQRSSSHKAPPLVDASTLVSVYVRLRPLFPKRSICLFDSVALLEFLARYHCLPHLVFGVALDPWAAHCWVQDNMVSFNEDAEHARTFLPIFVV